MAITGIMLIGFVIAHMIGNLKMYLGPAEFNHYGEFLRELLVPILPRTVALWLLRIGLIAAFVLHIHAAYGLTRINHEARAVKYQSPRDYQVANFASRTMRWTGIIVALFLVCHLADLTWGWVTAAGTDGTFVRGLPYDNVVRSLGRGGSRSSTSSPTSPSASTCSTARGACSSRSGWNNPRFNKWRRGLAIGIATIVVVGNCSFPIAVLAGIVDT